MQRNVKLVVLFALMAVLFLVAFGCGQTTSGNSEQTGAQQTVSAKPDVVTIGFQVIPNDEILAKAKGWYESELGAPVKFVQFDSGRDVNTAIVAKGIDIGLLGSTPASVGIAKGIPYQVFWIHDVIGDNEALVVKNGTNINSLKDLVGKKVAVPFGSTTHYSLLNALKIEGVDEKSVQILDLQPPDILAAWQRGDIDGAYVWQPTLAKLLSDGEIIVTSRQLAEKGIVTADVGIVRKEFAEKYPEIVKNYIAIQLKAVKYFNENPDDAAQAVAKELNITKEESLSQMKELVWMSGEEATSSKYLGTSASIGDFAKTLKATADFLVQQKTIESSPDQATFVKGVNPQFIEQALQK